MKIEKMKITNKVFLLIFDNQYEITSAFLRFQEYYESPKFRNKIFTLDEFKEWFSSLKGEFTYYTDWNGFNIPSYILKPFYKGKFNPLSRKEEKILDLFKKQKGNFYIIGIHRNMKNILGFLKHEIAHGLFYTDSRYYEDVIKVLNEFELTEIKRELRFKKGYHKKVLDDEVHAYSLYSPSKFKAKIPIKLKKELEKTYYEYLKKNNARLPSISSVFLT